MTIPNFISHYWGKAQPAHDTGLNWHPLVYHSLDVAATMKALLEARPKWLDDLAVAVGLSKDETRNRLILISAFHDIGKFAENFQQKIPELAKQFGHESMGSNAGHGSVGLSIWEQIKAPLELSRLDSWLHASLSHHGTPVDGIGNLANALSSKSQTMILDFMKATLALLGTPSEVRSTKKKYEIWRVAGLVILADWIGSNQNWFSYHEPSKGLADYWDLAQKRAKIALRDAQLSEAPCAADFNLNCLFGPNVMASPLQDWAQRQSPQSGPQLYMIEDLTGAGKTEAGLILAHRLMRAGGAEGLYWALPSMATANSLYARIEKNYKMLFDCTCHEPSLVLAHSASDLNDSFQASIQNGDIGTYGTSSDQDVSAESACATFIAEDRKKTFLAQVGIGTLDQALLGALPVRHQALRLMALSRRVLVIDEAHAYDEYMTKGMESLLKFQKLLGGSTIILSATLTQDQKRRFAGAYGASNESLIETGFPLTTHINGEGAVHEEAHVSLLGTRRNLGFRRFDDPHGIMDALLETAKAGYCGVYIRNSVKEAIEAYDYLKSRHDDVDIFHARFSLGDRIKRENSILKRFGKESAPEQRQGQILIATQVVEQSLDLDFDMMATDLCPMDLLIQRAGRLHRHTHRPNRPEPELWVVASSAEVDARSDWYSALFKSGQYVYPHVGQLWRTMKVLTAAGGLRLASGSPRDLIEPVFATDPSDLPPELLKQSQKAEAEQSGKKAIAYLNFLKRDDFTPQKESWAKDIHTPTRLGQPSTTLRLATWVEGVLMPWHKAEKKAWRLSEITIRSALCQKTIPPDQDAAKAIESQIRDWEKRYDPPQILALTATDQDGIWTGKWKNNAGKEVDVYYSQYEGLRY